MRLYLKTQIIAKFGNQSNFARASKKSDDWISRIVTGRRNPCEEDKTLILKAL